MTYDSITVTPVTPRVGAEIEGINLSKPLSNRELEELHGALLEYQVLFFRDQLLNEERHPADLRAAAAKQIVFELFNIEDGEQIIDGADIRPPTDQSRVTAVRDCHRNCRRGDLERPHSEPRRTPTQGGQ